jgi:hypothetical protein
MIIEKERHKKQFYKKIINYLLNFNLKTLKIIVKNERK